MKQSVQSVVARVGAWISWGSILAILILSIMSYFQLIEHETLGILEAILLCCVWLGVSTRQQSSSFIHRLILILVLIIVIAGVWLIYPLLFIYVPSIGINLLLAGFFFSTLRQGSEPAITRIARIERDEFSDELYQYTSRVTLAWALFFSGLVIEAIVLIRFAPVEITLLFLNILNYVLIGVFFIAENIYRRVRLPNYTHMPLLTLAARLSGRGGIMNVIKYRKHD